MFFLIRAIFYALWRVWFYLLIAVPIILFFPVLLVLSSREEWYPKFFWIARNIWANIILYGMGFKPRISREQSIVKGKSYMLIGNHVSMIDIMMMLKVSENPFVFVGKKELARIPIFGFFYKRVCILVDRSNPKSRMAVYGRAKARLDKGLSICIFPEGGVPGNEEIVLDAFRDGAFRLAIEYQIPLVPVVFLDNKRRFSYTFMKGSPGTLRARVLPFIETEGLSPNNKIDIKERARNMIFNALIS